MSTDPSPHRDIFQELADKLNLAYTPGDPGNQEWELMVADADKIPRFVAEFAHLDPDSQYVLAEILMASFDQAAENEAFPYPDWDVFWPLVAQDFERLKTIVAYWAMDDDEGSWALTPYLRQSLSDDGLEVPVWP